MIHLDGHGLPPAMLRIARRQPDPGIDNSVKQVNDQIGR
jgi:hypothetical protein